jgi:hypothetical protein
MRNNYSTIDHRRKGLPSIEIYGEQFHYQDLFEMVGCDQYMTTFNFKNGSEAFLKYGLSVMGKIFYDHEKLKALNESLQCNVEISENCIKVDSKDSRLTLIQKGELLKYTGINVSEIESLSYYPHKRRIEFHEGGEKKVPDVVTVSVDIGGIDPDILEQNYLVQKLNSGVDLAPFEKEGLLGIELGLNNGVVDLKLLAFLGISKDEVKENLNIWHRLYKFKERRGQLSELDSKHYVELKNFLATEKIVKVGKVYARYKMGGSSSEETKVILERIIESVDSFSPSILLHGNKQVYWDIDSYIHIALGHVKDYQFGNLKIKTPFVYRADDLELLIEKVLFCIQDELQFFLSQNSGKEYIRKGAMAVFYNGNHYNLRVNSGGRLTQFHVVSDDI